MKHDKLYIGMVVIPLIAGIVSKIAVPAGKPFLFWWVLGAVSLIIGGIGLYSDYTKQNNENN